MTPTSVKTILRSIPPIARVKDSLDQAAVMRQFRQEFQDFKTACEAGSPRFKVDWEDRYPCLNDRTAKTGFDRHYMYHCGWAARAVAQIKPAYHVDISSHLYFSTLVSAFVPVQFYDYRPADLHLDNLTCGSADLCGLPFDDRSVESLSCMHVTEHVGLGRYGDPLDPDGDLKAMAELSRVLAVGGSLLFVVPVGQPRIMFNAHRIYAYKQVMEAFSDLTLQQFAMIPDKAADGGLIVDAAEAHADTQRYACGCFWFKRGE